ncbi:MAG TPA: Ohr family peroxiredoxin [Lacunisphaera sp.]|nr:Ohr family peroxiredoxin [Lacunisphaera sp.]
MRTLYTVEAISKGGRRGAVWSPDRVLNDSLGDPLDPADDYCGPSPELLFAGAYAACFHGALAKVAASPDAPPADSLVRALVSLAEDAEGGSHLMVELHASVPGLDAARVRTLMEEAHRICPYSKALRGGGTAIRLVVDQAPNLSESQRT